MTTPSVVQISWVRAPSRGGALIRSIRWIMAIPSPLSSTTQGSSTGSAYGSRQRTAMWATSTATLERDGQGGEAGRELAVDVEVDLRVRAQHQDQGEQQHRTAPPHDACGGRRSSRSQRSSEASTSAALAGQRGRAPVWSGAGVAGVEVEGAAGARRRRGGRRLGAWPRSSGCWWPNRSAVGVGEAVGGVPRTGGPSPGSCWMVTRAASTPATSMPAATCGLVVRRQARPPAGPGPRTPAESCRPRDAVGQALEDGDLVAGRPDEVLGPGPGVAGAETGGRPPAAPPARPAACGRSGRLAGGPGA